VSDPFDLGRFVLAQEPVYARVCAELAAGRKRTHWMWFIFPQLAGLGSSHMARRYALGSLEEARAYLAHRVLGARLIECTQLVNAAPATADLAQIFGYPDDLKFRSCMTLFAHAQPQAPGAPFRSALQRYCAGAEDERTRALLT
jgi:uncharacterized protein (DUF1810 family)